METSTTTQIISLNALQKMAFNKKLPRKRVLLIDGNITESKYEADEYHLRLENLGIKRIAGYLKKFGISVDIAYLQDQKTSAMENLIQQSEIIGISSQSTSINESFELCRKIKNKYPQKTVIGGAEHFALDYKWILQHPEITGIDICCTGQGELPMLALSLGVPLKKIGSIAYTTKDTNTNLCIVENTKKTGKNFPRLTENNALEILIPVAASTDGSQINKMPFLELDKHFKNAGSTATSAGCIHKCTFCTSDSFYGGYVSCLDTAKNEIKKLYKQGKDFVFVRDALLNANPKHFEDFINFMKHFNQQHKNKMGWVAFMSVKQFEGLRKFKEMAEAGCIEIAVGVEDVIGNRKDLAKGDSLEVATEFINSAKKFLMVRTLLILGLPEHFRYTKDEIKKTMLTFMKKNPQTNYRINIWTPIVGTIDFGMYSNMFEKEKNARENPKLFRKHDTMHSVMDPAKMYKTLGVPLEKQWLKNSEDWAKLRDEIMREYLTSSEHKTYLETLRNKVNLNRKGLRYEIAQDFKRIMLRSIKK
ncbi:MAG: cobalamin-dependent protein [Candidatus Magasanikbacteria bacterium]